MKEEILKENDIYKSTDLAQVAMLQLYGYSIEALDRSSSDKVTFIFKRDEKLDELNKAYWSRNLQVEPLAYFESIKSIKTRLYQQ